MEVIDAIILANSEADIKTLSFANIKEFNSFIDSFNFSDYPVNVVVPFDNNGVRIGSLRKSIIPLQGWVLTRIDTDTVNVRTPEAHHNFIMPMTKLAIKFLTELLETDVVDPEVQNVSDSIKPEYAFLSMHLFGVSYTINLPIVDNVC